MGERMIVFTKNLDALGNDLVPSFAQSGSLDLSKDTPRQYAGGDVFVYSERSNKTFVYIGILRKPKLHENGELRFERYERLASPVVACDEAHGIDRPELYAPHRGFGAHCFNYITEEAHAAIEAASRNPTEGLLWQAISHCKPR